MTGGTVDRYRCRGSQVELLRAAPDTGGIVIATCSSAGWAQVITDRLNAHTFTEVR